VNPRTRTLSIALAMMAPLSLVPALQRALVPRITAAMVRPLVALASILSPVAPGPTPAGPALSVSPWVEPSHAPAPTLAGPPLKRQLRESSPPHIVVPKERLLHLSADQLRSVGWATVVGPRGRAAGVRLSGVAPLGVGLVDGDVVTSINGRATPTEDDATAAGTAAWVSGALAANATVLRGSQTIAVTLELPAREGGHDRY
jgi:hypothetical protein